LRISGFLTQPGNVMFSVFYDIIAEVIAAQRFVAPVLLLAFGKCHETCGCVTFREICVVCPAT
jgi:predicted aminopeptidase